MVNAYMPSGKIDDCAGHLYKIHPSTKINVDNFLDDESKKSPVDIREQIALMYRTGSVFYWHRFHCSDKFEVVELSNLKFVLDLNAIPIITHDE